jgi:exodeoxyribonuclease VII large subunit
MRFPSMPQDVISVSTLNRMARDLLESGLPQTWIGGELSNLTLAASGHAYFSLKDAGAQIRCVMFRQRLGGISFRPSNGMQVELRGTVTLYEARGEFQINVDAMRSAGLGRLYEAFAQLKSTLEKEGLFAAERKRRLPSLPRSIGIITSPAAAALRDVVTTLARRMPGIELILYPTPVQGEGSAQQIAQAISLAGARREVDLLIICRGGGSIEDLWSFNEEIVARAIATSPIPTICGIGHETDFTICDFVADLRAPTPTAAAEMASPSQEQLTHRLEQYRQVLSRELSRNLNSKTQNLDRLSHRLRHPGERLSQQQQQLAHLASRLEQLSKNKVQQARWLLQLAQQRYTHARPDLQRISARLGQQHQRLLRSMQQALQAKQNMAERLEQRIESINPQAVLLRGYAIVQNRQGIAVKSAEPLKQGERVKLTFAEGSTEALIDLQAKTQASLPFEG